MNPQDNPQFTAYALGELDFGQAREIHDELQTNSAAAHELEHIEAVTDALRHGAPIPLARLTPEQRHAVLHPTHLPRRMQPMMPRKPAPRPQPVFWTGMGHLLKAAAVITLTGGAFLAGWRMQPQQSGLAEVKAPKPPLPQPVPVEPMVERQPVVVVEAPAPAPEKVAAPAPKPLTPAPVVVAAAPPAPEKPKAAAAIEKPQSSQPVEVAESLKPVPAAVGLGFSMPRGAAAAFANTTRQPTAQYSLQPSLVRPPAPRRDPQVMASPVKPGTKVEEKPAKASDLLLYSWQSEIASCPWNPAHRLLRIVIQLPANQAPVISSTDARFPMEITFDAGAVKQFRLLCERHLPAADLSRAGTHVVWYEFQPNGAVESRESGRQIATVTVPKARFAVQPVGPFGGTDSSRLRVLDRGYTLQNAREDFIFETAVVGFGLLMRGAEQTGSLNHDMVLDLATRAKGGDGPNDRSRFIKLVQDAQKVVGL
ncbi:MAG: DUF3520 domain-containing protein [Verrucomicrobiaceae bacterium]|nr:DUF3520 domain-containing protein [Verrucomicrobiaceae bacterium]